MIIIEHVVWTVLKFSISILLLFYVFECFVQSYFA